MLKDLINFFSGLKKVDYKMLRGMEIYYEGGQDISRARFFFKIHTVSDIFYFYVMDRYSNLLPQALGKVRFLYKSIYKPEIQGLMYYILPWAWMILLSRELRRAWFIPFDILYRNGFAEIPKGQQIDLFWFKYLRIKK